MDDTGLNIKEPLVTLRAQQQQLVEGRRFAQMFPEGSKELDLPRGFSRLKTERGIFHFNPNMISEEDVRLLSGEKRENELLGLGPYNKQDVLERVSSGEPMLVITERTPNGVEVKASLGTPSTATVQLEFLEKSKTPGNVIKIEDVNWVLAKRLCGGQHV